MARFVFDDAMDQVTVSHQTETTTTMQPASKRANNNHKRGPANHLEHVSAHDWARMTISERKRHREQRRRSKLGSAFDKLLLVLCDIDAEFNAHALGKAPPNRVQILNHAMTMLQRLHQENEQHKVRISELNNQLEQNQDDQLTLLLPTFVPIGARHPVVARPMGRAMMQPPPNAGAQHPVVAQPMGQAMMQPPMIPVNAGPALAQGPQMPQRSTMNGQPPQGPRLHPPQPYPFLLLEDCDNPKSESPPCQIVQQGHQQYVSDGSELT